jgi:hypothetical protein
MAKVYNQMETHQLKMIWKLNNSIRLGSKTEASNNTGQRCGNEQSFGE